MTLEESLYHKLYLNDNRFLCFSLGKEHFCIPLLSIKEVIGVPEFTQIPYSPDYFCGIMNLRGKVISVIDLRKKLKIESRGKEENSVVVCLIENITMGILVDSVDSVINIQENSIMPKPNFQTELESSYIEGLIEYKKNLYVLINLAKALSIEDIIQIKEAG